MALSLEMFLLSTLAVQCIISIVVELKQVYHKKGLGGMNELHGIKCSNKSLCSLGPLLTSIYNHFFIHMNEYDVSFMMHSTCFCFYYKFYPILVKY